MSSIFNEQREICAKRTFKFKCNFHAQNNISTASKHAVFEVTAESLQHWLDLVRTGLHVYLGSTGWSLLLVHSPSIVVNTWVLLAQTTKINKNDEKNRFGKSKN